jgi:hypothetical protein
MQLVYVHHGSSGTRYNSDTTLDKKPTRLGFYDSSESDIRVEEPPFSILSVLLHRYSPEELFERYSNETLKLAAVLHAPPCFMSVQHDD